MPLPQLYGNPLVALHQKGTPVHSKSSYNTLLMWYSSARDVLCAMLVSVPKYNQGSFVCTLSRNKLGHHMSTQILRLLGPSLCQRAC